MKNVVVYMFALLAFITSLALDVRGGQSVIGELPKKLPIGDVNSIRDWTITNTMWKTEVSVQIMYQDSVDTNLWGGNFAWSIPMQFSSYRDYESYLQEEGMYWIDRFILEGYASPGSESGLVSIISIDIGGREFGPLVIHTNLGPIELVTSNSFLGIPQRTLGVFIPIKNLERLELQCGYPESSWPPKYSYIWDHGSNTASWWDGDCDITDALIINTNQVNVFFLGSKFNLATQRIRLTIVSDGQKNEYTQHGDRLKPASVTRNGDMLEIETPRGSDIAIEASYDGLKSWKNITSRSWFENTNRTSLKIDSQTSQGFYRVSIR